MLYFKYAMSATCFDPEGSSSGRRFYVQIWYIVLTRNGINSLVGGRVCKFCSFILYNYITMQVQKNIK